MPISNIKKITTNDTKKTYTFTDGARQDGTPQLWQIECTARPFCNDGSIGPLDRYGGMQVFLIVERQTLVNAGELPVVKDDSTPPPGAPTMEEIILQLLDMVGVRPNE